MKENKCISIVVPVYNQKKYLNKCLDSIVKQTYENIEIILVDDGSNDGSESICDEYASKDLRIKTIHKRNGGLVSAWKKGLSVCNTEYVVFIDSDDWVSPDYLKCMVEEQIQTNADLIVTHMNKAYPNGELLKDSFNINVRYYGKNEIKELIYPHLINNGNFQGRAINTSRCGKLIKAELLRNNIKYVNDKVTYEEDFNIMIPVLIDANSISLVDDERSVYFVRQNPYSMTHAYDRNMRNSTILVYESLGKALKQKNFQGDFESQLETGYLNAMVQNYKNTLLIEGGYRRCVKEISEFCENNEKLKKAICDTNWRHYRKLNILIIYCMKNFQSTGSRIITFFLRGFKLYRCKKLLHQDSMAEQSKD